LSRCSVHSFICLGVIYLNGQHSAGADTYQVAFVLFLVMGRVPEWLNLIVVALGWTLFRSSAGARLFGGAAMAYLPKPSAFRTRTRSLRADGMAASSACWWLSVWNPEVVDQI
jgi:hypothetical protein